LTGTNTYSGGTNFNVGLPRRVRAKQWPPNSSLAHRNFSSSPVTGLLTRGAEPSCPHDPRGPPPAGPANMDNLDALPADSGSKKSPRTQSISLPGSPVILWSHISRGRARPVHIANCSFDGRRRFARSVGRSASAPLFNNCSGGPEFRYTDRAPMCCGNCRKRTRWPAKVFTNQRMCIEMDGIVRDNISQRVVI
jgi:hypothetical protein